MRPPWSRGRESLSKLRLAAGGSACGVCSSWHPGCHPHLAITYCCPVCEHGASGGLQREQQSPPGVAVGRLSATRRKVGMPLCYQRTRRHWASLGLLQHRPTLCIWMLALADVPCFCSPAPCCCFSRSIFELAPALTAAPCTPPSGLSRTCRPFWDL